MASIFLGKYEARLSAEREKGRREGEGGPTGDLRRGKRFGRAAVESESIGEA